MKNKKSREKSIGHQNHDEWEKNQEKIREMKSNSIKIATNEV